MVELAVRIAAIVAILSLMSISLAAGAASFTITLDEAGTATFMGNTTNITGDLPQGINITDGHISGHTSVLTTKNQDVWTFSFEFPDSSIEVILPNNSVVEDIEGNLSIMEQQILIQSRDNISVSYKFVTAPRMLVSPQQENSNTSEILIIILLLAFIIFTYMRWSRIVKAFWKWVKKHTYGKYASRRRKTSIDKKLAVLSQVLSVKQNKILLTLKDKGSMKASYLQRECDMPKTSFFRNLVELEKKGLVKRIGPGRNRIVEIVK